MPCPREKERVEIHCGYQISFEDDNGEKGDKAQLEIANFSLFQKLIEFHMSLRVERKERKAKFSNFNIKFVRYLDRFISNFLAKQFNRIFDCAFFQSIKLIQRI